MAFKDVRQYFRTRLDAIGGYAEWTDGFDFNNIPSSIIDKSYHIEMPRISSGPANSVVHRYSCQVTLRVFFAASLDVSSVIDYALDSADEILSDCLDINNRLGTTIKDVRPVEVATIPLSVSNNNGVGLEISFECLIINCS
jgi:hypothetical protein